MQLKWFARQYDELKRRETRFRLGDVDRRPGNGGGIGHGDPTGSEAIRMASSPYAWKIAAIEQAAVTASPELCKWILKSVTEGVPLERLQPPCGKNQFYAARRRFFIELDSRMP